MKNYIVLDGMIGNQKDVLCTAFDKGYKQGLEDGKESVQIDETEAYKRGMNAAWDVARKLMLSKVDGGFDYDELKCIFGDNNYYTLLRTLSPFEAIAKIKEYEEKQEEDAEIKIGDEVIENGTNFVGVVTNIRNFKNIIYVTYKDGSSGLHKMDDFTKTGRHFDQIAKVLAKMQDGEKEVE